MTGRSAASTPVDVTPAHVRAFLARVQPKLTAEESGELEALAKTLLALVALLAKKRTSVARLRALVFGPATETTRAVLARAGLTTVNAGPATPAGERPGPTHRRRGHGRRGAASYPGAPCLTTAHPHLQAGDPCPCCDGGKVYRLRHARVWLRFVAHAPFASTRYEGEQLRCHLCGEVFAAALPADAGADKYDATTGALVALLKYGNGMPFNRLARLQAHVGVPLPASIQWELVAALAARIQPVVDELMRRAAQGDVIYNDDTRMRVLSLLPAAPQPSRPTDSSEEVGASGDDQRAKTRRGVFTSGIVATGSGHPIALYFTGHRHAGENLAAVLAARPGEMGPPVQMCDALSSNTPGDFAVVLANCLAHARRKVVEVAADFPAESHHVLETLRDVYACDAQARAEGLSPEAGLLRHQRHSAPLMADLHTWFSAQLEDHLVEPNSGLGEAIRYFLKHWKALTRFLEVAGAPLDSNLVERALKKAILHRKGALFYKTVNGARVGHRLMGIIHTCELNRVNPFEYLVQLQHHAEAVQQAPAAWLPWTYRDTLRRLHPPTQAA